MRGPILLALCLVWTAQAAAQDAETRSREEIHAVFDRGCGDDRGTDRCDSEVQSRMHGLYGIAGPNALLQENVTTRRAMFVDGYGTDVVAIVFSRGPGSSPTVEIFTPHSADAPPASPLSAHVTDAVWQEVIARSENFDQQLARELPRTTAGGVEEQPIRICLHSWFVVVEAVDPPRVMTYVLAGTGSEGMARDPALPVEASMSSSSIRIDAEGACADGLAMDYAFAMADLAVESLAECSTLDAGNFRTVANLLALCHRLGGDRHTAGEANALTRALQDAMRSEDENALRWLFVGSGSARADMFRDAFSGGTLYFQPPIAVDPDRSEIHGEIAFVDGDGSLIETAPFTLRLLRQVNGFKIDTFSVGERQPYTPTE